MHTPIRLGTMAIAFFLASSLANARNPTTPPQAKPAGKAESCIPLQMIRETQVYGDQAIDFHMTDGRVYRNTLPDRCPQLGFEETFTYSTSLSQLCSTDIITVLVTPGMSRGASCGLGSFQPVELARRSKSMGGKEAPAAAATPWPKAKHPSPATRRAARS